MATIQVPLGIKYEGAVGMVLISSPLLSPIISKEPSQVSLATQDKTNETVNNKHMDTICNPIVAKIKH